MFKNRKTQPKRPVKNRWQDDDDDNQIPSSSSTSSNYSNYSNYSKPSFFKEKPVNPQPSFPPQYTQQTRYQQKQFDLEQKLLEDILQPTGISIKPSENILRDFCKRLKTLDREKIFYGIMERVNPYKTYTGNQEKIKLLMKCLYLIEFLIDNKIDALYEAFDERQELFEDIRKTFSSNKKIVETIGHILKVFNPNETSDGYNNFSNSNNEKKQEPPKENANLLEIGGEEQSQSQIQLENKVNLLEDIFGGSNTQNNNQNILVSNNNPLFDQSQQKTNDTFSQQKEESKKPSFIKSKKNIQNKGFSFIKSKDNATTQQNQQNLLNDIFSSPSEDATNFNLIGNNNNQINNDMNNILNQQSQIASIDFTKIDNTYKKENKEAKAVEEKPKFNYDLVYQNTDSLKDKNKDNKNDPFNFVNDMIKPKK